MKVVTYLSKNRKWLLCQIFCANYGLSPFISLGSVLKASTETTRYVLRYVFVVLLLSPYESLVF